MIPEYKYQVKDYSLLTPFFREKIVRPLMRFVPWGIPANIVTIISNLFMFAATAMAILIPHEFKYHYLIIPICILIYAIFDHIDGMQAKRTKTSSALGEFFDHHFDVYNNGILLVVLFKLFNITNPLFAAILFSISYLAHAAVFYEQFTTKWLIFDQIGSLESVILLSSVMFLGFYEPFYVFLTTPVYFNFTYIEIFFIISITGAFLTYLKTLYRAKITAWRFYLYCFLLAVIVYAGSKILTINELFFIITLYNVVYIGNLQKGHLADTIERLPDMVLPVLLCIFVFITFIEPFTKFLILLCYIGIRAVYVGSGTIYILRGFWVWKNPK